MVRPRRKNKSLQVGLMVLYFLGVGYFSYHALSGDRGALAMVTLGHQLDEAKVKLEKTKTERQQLEHRVSLLRPNSLDLDVLDEQTRSQLGLARDDEMVILLDKDN
ncbi:MAG: septum formation initiator family protein [Alphaproteobacteria bacterium]|nr:septum formation initiator family protein [Alphaproteobacteria bacterium]